MNMVSATHNDTVPNVKNVKIEALSFKKYRVEDTVMTNVQPFDSWKLQAEQLYTNAATLAK